MSENVSSDSGRQSLPEKGIYIFKHPSLVFTDLQHKGEWRFPFTLIAVVTIISILSTTDLQMEAQREFINNSEIIPEENKVEMLDALENQGIINRKVIPAVAGAVSLAVSYLIIAGALLFFGNFIYGGQARFAHVFAMVCWAGMIYLPELAIKLPFILALDTLHIYTSPALFLGSASANTVLFTILDAFDVFAIWRIILISTGFAVIYNFSMKKSFTAVILLYVIYKFISLGVNQLFSGVMF